MKRRWRKGNRRRRRSRSRQRGETPTHSTVIPGFRASEKVFHMAKTKSPADDPHRYLEPLTLAKVRSLELKARLIVEGYLSGMHKSPYHGFSVEFAQHREYVPGDDIKHIDWKVYGRTGRFFLKQYEQDTNLICWLVVDASESMKYGSGNTTKYDYACLAAASLAFLIVQQT